MFRILTILLLFGCSQKYISVLKIEESGYKIELLTSDGKLKERENKVKFIIEPKPSSFKAYLFMPEMPGMPAMTELFELNKNYEGKVFIPMSGEWQIIIEVDGKTIKKAINIPFDGKIKETETHEHSSLYNIFNVKSSTSFKEITIEGTIAFQKNSVYKIIPRFSGQILNVYISNEGQAVSKGQKLFSFYSPEILRIKNEFLISKDSLVLEKLKLLNLSIEDIFEDSAIFRSPVSGKISKLYINNGDKFEENSTILEIVNNSVVLFMGNVRKSEFGDIKVGDIIYVKNSRGYISEILPSSDGNFIKIVSKIENDGSFFENSYEIGRILKPVKGIIVPRDAIIRTGNSDVVYVFEDGEFKPRVIKIITDVKDGYLVSGLKEGEKIVYKGVFLIDADAKLKGI
ncbi:MAG: efflux RND transporter periplasmic adaptor subunit [candidate division WOR-3 bacterium]|jgi:Cu(I)/Ag(I) efflux system membrane fusion protein